MSQVNNPDAVVIDASILVSISSKEAATYIAVEAALDSYTEKGSLFFAPNVIVGEVIFALCQKLVSRVLTEAQHEKAIESFIDLAKDISMPKNEMDLVVRANKIRQSYGCSRSADGLYIALAEDLEKIGTVVLLTLDKGMTNQAEKNAPTVTVKVL